MAGKRLQRLIPLVAFLLIVLGCQMVYETFELPRIIRFVLPKPSVILRDLWQNWPWLLRHLKITLYEALCGFCIAVVLGVALALSYLFVPALERVIVPLAIAVRNIPFVAIAPILFILLGYGPLPKIIIVMIVTFFPVMSNLSAGFSSVSRSLLERFYIYRATRWQLFAKLQLPAAMPYFVAGLEIGISNTVIAAIVGELLGTTAGLGFVILLTVSQYRIPLLMATVLVTTLASIAITTLSKWSTRLMLRRWLQQFE